MLTDRCTVRVDLRCTEETITNFLVSVFLVFKELQLAESFKRSRGIDKHGPIGFSSEYFCELFVSEYCKKDYYKKNGPGMP